MKRFTKCPNGHYYKEELAACPYCRSGNGATEIISSPQSLSDPKTELLTDDSSNKAPTVVAGFTSLLSPQPSNRNSTVFGEEVLTEVGGKEVVKTDYRSSRKLVGWLVSYSFDKMGADFRIYEGRNIIGRDMDCNITVPDKMISGKHATILFKNDRFKIKDGLSSHGTYVNGNDIEDGHVELHDNDVIRIGETELKFKSSF